VCGCGFGIGLKEVCLTLIPVFSSLLLVAGVLCVAVECHFRINFQPSSMAIRNAPTRTGDGAWSVDGAGCGGVNTWGTNGVTDVVVGQSIALSFNYGTGERAKKGNFSFFFCSVWSLDGIVSFLSPGDHSLSLSLKRCQR
jgi:hypothetical protein